MIGALNGSLREPLVVGYHGVVEDLRAHAETAIPAILTSRATLEKHLDGIGRRRRFVSLDVLGERLSSGEGRGQPVAAVTFDDGYANVYDHALPVLRRKGIPAAIFVVTDLVGTSRPHLHDYLYLLLMRAYTVWRDSPRELGRLLGLLGLRLPWVESQGTESAAPLPAMQALLRDLPQRDVRRVIQVLQGEVEASARALSSLRPVSWEMLAEMRRAGFTIGSHTRSHALLTQESRAKVLEEIRGSRQSLERRLGGTVEHFAYPGGRFDRPAIRAVRGAGYRFAYTTCGHRDPSDPMMTIPRRLLWEHACRNVLGQFSPAILDCQVHGVFDAASRCRMDHGAERSAA